MVTKYIILIILTIEIIVNNSRNSVSENRNINISDNENYNIVTSNLVNSSIDENHDNFK